MAVLHEVFAAFADFEGGLGYRFAGSTLLPRGMALGATRNPDLAYQAGKITATEERLAGVHINFYLVVDSAFRIPHSRSDNPQSGIRNPQ